jgi:hypothetical protein
MVALATGSTSLAGQLDAQQRQDFAVVVLVGGCVTDLARQNEVSRKFIYQQKEQALQESFTPSAPDEKVLFICRSPKNDCTVWYSACC